MPRAHTAPATFSMPGMPATETRQGGSECSTTGVPYWLIFADKHGVLQNQGPPAVCTEHTSSSKHLLTRQQSKACCLRRGTGIAAAAVGRHAGVAVSLKVPALGMNSTCPWPGDAIATASAALALVLLPASEHTARHDASTASAASGRPCGIRK